MTIQLKPCHPNNWAIGGKIAWFNPDGTHPQLQTARRDIAFFKTPKPRMTKINKNPPNTARQ